MPEPLVPLPCLCGEAEQAKEEIGSPAWQEAAQVEKEAMMPIEFPIWDLRGTGMPLGEAAITASAIREAVFWRLKEHNVGISWLILSQLALCYSSARWWIEQGEQKAYYCLQRLLDLRRANDLGTLAF